MPKNLTRRFTKIMLPQKSLFPKPVVIESLPQIRAKVEGVFKRSQLRMGRLDATWPDPTKLKLILTDHETALNNLIKVYGKDLVVSISLEYRDKIISH